MPTRVGHDLRFIASATDIRADESISRMPTSQATDYFVGTRVIADCPSSGQAFCALWLETGLFAARDSLNVLSKPEDYQRRHHDREQQELARKP
jgi:hypothetical protein